MEPSFYFVRSKGIIYGPFSVSRLLEMYRKKEIDLRNDPVSPDKKTWHYAFEKPPLNQFVPVPAAPPLPPPPPPRPAFVPPPPPPPPAPGAAVPLPEEKTDSRASSAPDSAPEPEANTESSTGKNDMVLFFAHLFSLMWDIPHNLPVLSRNYGMWEGRVLILFSVCYSSIMNTVCALLFSRFYYGSVNLKTLFALPLTIGFCAFSVILLAALFHLLAKEEKLSGQESFQYSFLFSGSILLNLTALFTLSVSCIHFTFFFLTADMVPAAVLTILVPLGFLLFFLLNTGVGVYRSAALFFPHYGKSFFVLLTSLTLICMIIFLGQLFLLSGVFIPLKS